MTSLRRRLEWAVVVLLLALLLGLWLVTETLAHEHGKVWQGLSPSDVYCFEDQFGNFYGFQLFATESTSSIKGWGHRHDTSAPKGDPRWLQTMDVVAYYFPETDTAKVTFDVHCVAPGCQGFVADVICDYAAEPWTCTGEGENRDGSRFPVELVQIGLNWGDRQECTAAHP